MKLCQQEGQNVKVVKTILLQEGPSYLWQDFPIELQIEYYQALQEVDGILCHNDIDKNFCSDSLDVSYYIIPSGEISKNIENYAGLIGYLTEKNFTRNDIIIALGGGVVNDIAGFAAATYMRGIRWFCIPTTLLAQSDACIGGKTAVHFAGVKNLIGAFHQPSLILIDPEFLKTLDMRDYLCGLAEIMKMSLLPGNENFSILNGDFRTKLLENNEPATDRLNENIKIIEESCRYKAKIIAQDEFDRAGRIALNLGHTLGHALEAALGFGKAAFRKTFEI